MCYLCADFRFSLGEMKMEFGEISRVNILRKDHSETVSAAVST